MAKLSIHITLLLLVYFLKFFTSTDQVCRRSTTEYLLPYAEQTHEIAIIGNIIFISQFDTSVLIKALIDERGQVTHIKGHLLYTPDSAIHGLFVSQRYKRRLWVTLEHENKLLLLNPEISNYPYVDNPPSIDISIQVPQPGGGPHHVIEHTDELWVTLKASNHILRINIENPAEYNLYPTQPTPIFVARHPVSGHFYSGELQSSSLIQIDPVSHKVNRMPIPPHIGTSPVGVVAGAGNVWVALLDIDKGGGGMFGKIYENGTINWFRLQSKLGRDAALLHVAFGSDNHRNGSNVLWLLGSSAETPKAVDMVIKTTFDSNFEVMEEDKISVLPSQSIKAHRILVTDKGVYTTELTSSRFAFLEETEESICDFGFEKDKIATYRNNNPVGTFL